MNLIVGRKAVWCAGTLLVAMTGMLEVRAQDQFAAGANRVAMQHGVAALDEREFSAPSARYRPTISVEEGAGYAAPLDVAARRAIVDLDAGGVMISPQGDPARHKPLDLAAVAATPLGLLDEYPAGATPWLPKALPGEARFGTYLADGNAGPGKEAGHGYMTPAWFDAMRRILELAKENGRTATYYDEVGFPSGSADGTIPEKFHRKVLRREEWIVPADQPYAYDLTPDDTTLALVAINDETRERRSLLPTATDGRVMWAPPGDGWRVQRFAITTTTAKDKAPDYNATADYLDAEASSWFIQNSYDRAYEGLSDYFGTTIQYTFFDDVGIYADEKTWHREIDQRFEKITGRPAAIYYPALWEDIGPETSAARVAFFKARAELLGDTFPKLVTDWARAHGVKSTGHAPGNYDLQPTETIGDPFKFYAHTDVPLADALWGIGFARGGFKLISSVSAQRDLPLTGVEAFSVTHDANGYRRMIELFVRGFNHFVTGAREPSNPRGTAQELSRWAGRSSYLLQGGRHVADVAVVFPIESLQAFYSFDAPGNVKALPTGVYAYADADYQAVGEFLMSELRRDFTFVHPDALAGDKLQVSGNALVMQNEINREAYRVLILPGGEVMSVAAMKKIKDFYQNGGAVIATSLLPTRSAELGKDRELRELVADVFGEMDPQAAGADIRRHGSGGQSSFIRHPDPASLGQALQRMGIRADVEFKAPVETEGNGVFGYTHRQKGGKEIYYFGNSGDTAIRTTVALRGHVDSLQTWNPHDGAIADVSDVRHVGEGSDATTVFELHVDAVSSIAIVGVARSGLGDDKRAGSEGRGGP